MKTVYGIGINNEKYQASRNGKLTKEYSAWRNMLHRCYKTQENQASYYGCTTSDDFKYYHRFYEWYKDQIGSDQENFDLDKDLLFKNNKIYSKDTCILLPAEINGMLTNRKRFRGDYPQGVHYYKRDNCFRAQMNVYRKRTHLGYFSDIESAFSYYKLKKESYVKDIAGEYKDQIDQRAYIALLNYTVEITD